MQIATDLAGFSKEEADTLRKAIGKKIKELMDKKKGQFIEGMGQNKINEKIAREIWEWIEPFAQYSFNKSHAAAYAQIAYQTAYLKAHYPREFMSALLTADQGDTERVGFLINDCKKIKIDVLPPDINESFMGFSVVPDKNEIRFGLSAIKNVGDKVVEVIVKERKENGQFKSLDDFLSRIQPPTLNKKSLESLVKSGSFDRFKPREDLIHNLERLLEYSREKGKCKNNGQSGLFDSDLTECELSLEKAPEVNHQEKLKWEKELLGLFVTGHPLEYLKEKTRNGGITIKEAKRKITDTRVRVGVVISAVKKITTKKGDPMLFVTVEDLEDNMEVIVFPKTLQGNGTAFEEGKSVFISGKINNRDESPKIICENIEPIE
jgi:DNA polymerase-3 subunit alpha